MGKHTAIEIPLDTASGERARHGGAHRVTGPKILLVVGGGIAAYKACELVRLIRKAGGEVTCVLTKGGSEFVTPMALAALSGNKVYTSLFDLKDEVEMGHIELSRQADLIVVCPATADLMAKMAAGIADDLATTLILATDKPVVAVPAMNVKMWEHGATQRNADWLRQAGVKVMDPEEGTMACGEIGPGRLPEPISILRFIADEIDLSIDVPELPAPSDEVAFFDDEEEILEEIIETPEARDDEAAFEEMAAEALEPDEEEEVEIARSRGGLGSLLSAIIPRATARRSHAEIEEAFEAELEQLPDEEPIEAELPVEPLPDDAAPLDTPPLDMGGPLLAKKGKASGAPSIDPSAINHEVGLQNPASAPEPMALRAYDASQTAAVAHTGEILADDPLAGQPAFDEDPDHRPLYGRHVLVTAGPTWEPIDPVRYIANRSSGKQGFAIAAMAAAAGARVTLVAGPVQLPTPLGVDRVDVESADEMAAAVKEALPADAAFMVAAVADWKSRHVASEKMKKRGSAPPALILAEHPDILATVSGGRKRPALLVGFAAETENVVDNAKSKRKRKGADWIIANNVSDYGDGSVMGGDANQVHIVTPHGVESLPEMPKMDVARELVRRAAEALVSGPAEHDD